MFQEESQDIEYKESWKDEYLKWICGFANAHGGRIFIGINDEKEVVGIKNSKQLMEDISNKHTSKPRNLNIANAFYKAGFIESWGRGIGIIQAGFKQAGLPAPKLEATMGGVLIVMPRGCQKKNETVNETVRIGRSEAIVLDLIQRNNTVTYQTLMQVTKLSRATIARIIKKLQDNGFIHRIGSDKNGIWEFVNK